MATRARNNLNPVERLLSLFTTVRPGEGWSVLLFALYGFLLLACYYILKTIREALLLTEFGAEVRSYAAAVTALLLMFVVPLYGVLFRSIRKIQLVHWVTWFFIANIMLFWALARAQVDIGFFYFVFAGIFGVMVVAQFWAFAADSYNVKSGQRLFPIIMVGASAGALAGAQLTKYLTAASWISPAGMLLVAAGILTCTLLLGEFSRQRIPEASRSEHVEDSKGDRIEQLLGGFAIVLRSRYLMLLALLVVVLNWVNTTGETILAYFVRDWAYDAVAAGASATRGELIASFYGDFFFWVNLLGFLFQAFLVARLYRWIGVGGALLILPSVALLGYGIMAFIPIFSIIRLVKILENSVDYSINQTTRHALYLPLGRAQKYEGKTTIDTFFWRFGDLIQAGAFWVGLNVAGLTIPQFAFVNLALAGVWLGLAIALGRRYRHHVRENALNVAPEVNRPIPDIEVPAGHPLLHQVPEDTFVDKDPGDVLTLSAQLATGEPLPYWLTFDPASAVFAGVTPQAPGTIFEVEVVATDFEGLSARDCFQVRLIHLNLSDGVGPL